MAKAQKNEVAQVEVIEQVAETTSTSAPVEETKQDSPIALDGSQAESYIKDQGSVSKAIRTLFDAGLTRGQIAKALNKRYQHVRNVLITPLKKTA